MLDTASPSAARITTGKNSKTPATTWLFVRATESVRLSRLPSDTPQLLVIGPGAQRQVHIGRDEEDLGIVQMRVEQRLQRHGWSYEGSVREATAA